MKLNRSTIWRVGILCAFIAIIGSLSVCRPTALSRNSFLTQFMGPDLISALVVILTITFASVANIHLSIGRMIIRSKNPQAAKDAASRVRSQINSNAWLIFWGLVVVLVALFIYGEFPRDDMVRAVMVAICLTVVLLNGLGSGLID